MPDQNTSSISEMERQEQEAITALREEFPEFAMGFGCDRRYEVWDGHQLWEYDTLPAVRQRIVWALANR